MRAPGVCAFPKKLESIAATHGAPRPPHCWTHNSKRHIVRFIPPVPGLWTCFVHASCICNEIVGVTNRVLGDVPPATVRGISELRIQVKKLAAYCGTLTPWTLERTIDSFKGARKKRYQRAGESLAREPLERSDARISTFTKAEKMDPTVKKNPDPRMIQARTPRYNVKIAQYLRPVEHFIYNLKDRSGLRAVAKGLNQKDRATLIREKFKLFKKPVCFSIDCSRWDKHINYDVLGVEHEFYKRLLPNQPEFNKLLDWQRINKCRTAGGLKYTVFGGRMSGDINTALGNCLLMVLMARAAMKMLKIVKYELVDDGDDCLVIVEEEDFDVVNNNLAKIFLEFGQELKIENVSREVGGIVFCQSRVVHNGEDWIMVRDWRKVLSHACSGTKHWNNPEEVRPMLGLVGRCELALGAGVPILQSYALALIRNSRGLCAKTINAEAGVLMRLKAEAGDDAEEWLRKAASRPITSEARIAFRDAYNVPLWQQHAIESRLRSWNIDVVDTITVCPEWDHTWQDQRGSHSYIPILY